MPSAYTHYLVAAATLIELKEKDILPSSFSPRFYFFASQGADFCFFYRAFRLTELNYGRFLHGKGGLPFFRVLLAVSKKRPQLISYAFGYISHYAVDLVFHPYIYYLAGKSPVRHTLAEGALDYRFRSLFPPESIPVSFETEGHVRAYPDSYDYFNVKLSKEEMDELYTLYALVAAQTGRAPLIKPQFLKSISSYLSYTGLSEKLFLKKRQDVLNAEKSAWSYPADEKIIKTDGADELFVRAEKESFRLIQIFYNCIQKNLPLPEKEFGKSFLKGI